MSKMILIIEDEESIQNIIRAFLEDAGYTVVLAADGLEGIEQFRVNKPDLVLLDLMLPKIDGFAVCEILRKESRVPIIMLTALDDDDSQMKGFDALADDYITKPFNPVEVIARVKSQLRRYMQLGSGQIKKDAIVIGGIELNDNSKQVTVDGELVSLTPTEYDILRLLMEHPGQVFSPRDIYKEVWKETPLGAEGSVAVHIRHLREKIEINPGEPRYIKVIWGRGYKMEYQ